MSPVKVVKVTILLATILVILILVALPLLREVDTVYPTDFNKAGWKQVKPGMTESEIIGLLGEPLHKEAVYWQYGEAGSLGVDWLGSYIGANLKRVYFDEYSRVSHQDPDFY